MAGKSGRTISNTQKKGFKSYLLSWEGVLAIIFIAVNILGAIISPVYTFSNVLREMPKYLCEIFMMFAMGFILIIAEIDISVGAIVCLGATLGCFVANTGAPLIVVMIVCIGTGTLCGLLNGVILTHFTTLPAMIVTLGTQIIFRGIAEVSLGSGGSVSMTNSATIMPLATMIGPFSLSFFMVAICAVIYILVLSKTTFGRRLYAVGSNHVAAKYSGINVQKTRLICFILIGMMAGICAMFYLSTTFGANTSTGQGYEMDVIAMCVFGGIATTGGKGNLVGATIAGFTIVCLRIALGQRNINTQLILVIIGVLLIVSVLIPRFSQIISDKKKKSLQSQS